MVNVLCQIRKYSAKYNFRVENAKGEDKDQILRFLDQEQKVQLFGYTKNEWPRRQQIWSHAEIERFIVVRDPAGKIVACTLPWSPAPAKKIIVQRLPFVFKLVRSWKKILPFLNIPGPNQELKTIYLTHLCVCSQLPIEKGRECLALLLNLIWKRFPRNSFHCITYADFSDHALAPKELFFLQQKIPMKFLSLSAKKDKTVKGNPAFEIALV